MPMCDPVMPSVPTLPDTEVIVIGGGPAGSVTALLLARMGHAVTLLDKASFPRHKACSEYMNAGGVRVLEEIGVLPDALALGAHRMRSMKVHAPSGAVFTTDFDRAEPGRYALGLSRYRLDQILVDHADAAGVTVIERAHIRDMVTAGGKVTGVMATIDGTRQTLAARVVVGADGHHSVVSRSLGLDRPVRWPASTGLVAHYRGVSGLQDNGEMHVVAGAYAGLAPLEDGLVNVAYVSGKDSVGGREKPLDQFFEEQIAAIPGLAGRFAGAKRIGGIRGVGPMARRSGRTVGDGFLLVGDAASFLDPFTGDGIYEAMKAAQLAAPVISAALRAGDCSAEALEPYRRARRRAFTTKRQVCWIVQGIIHTPALMNYVTPRLEARSEVGLVLSGVLGNMRPASAALSPVFLARLLRP